MPDSYPSDWNTRRKKVYSRDDYKCQNCGVEGGKLSTAELHAHHIVPVSKGGSHNQNNLVTICDQCHKSIHNESKMARSEASSQQKRSPENYEGLDKAAIKIGNIIDEINETTDYRGSQRQRLHEYLEKMLKYVDEPGMKAPDKLASAYIKIYNSYEESLSESRSRLIEMKEIVSQFNFSSETNQSFSSFLEKSSNRISCSENILNEYDSIAKIEDEDVILSVVSPDSIEWDVNIQVAYDKLGDAAKEEQEAYLKFNKHSTNDLENN